METTQSLLIITLSSRSGSNLIDWFGISSISLTSGLNPHMNDYQDIDADESLYYFLLLSDIESWYIGLVDTMLTFKERTMSSLTNRDILRMRLDVLNALRRERHIVVSTPDLDSVNSWFDDTPDEIIEQIVAHLEQLLHIAPTVRR